MADLPTPESILGPPPRPGELPTVESILGAPPEPSLFEKLSSAAGNAMQWTEENVPFAGHGASTAILRAFGHGAVGGFGAEPLGFAPEELKRITPQANDALSMLERQFVETMMRPAGIVGDLMLKRLPSALYGGVRGVAEEPGVPAAARLPAAAATAGMEAFPAGPMTGLPLPPELGEARGLGIIGPAEDEAARAALQPRGAPSATERVVSRETPAPPAPQPPPDIHAVARGIAPDVFGEYDALAARKQTLRDWISELGEGRQNSEEATGLQGRIDNILGKVNGIEERLTKRAAARLDDARTQLDDLLGRDTPEMAQVRQSLMETDYRMRDLAPQVSAAYRDARAQFPEEAPPEATSEPEPPPITAPNEPPSPALPPRVDIAADIEKQLTAAGRPPEEANAAGQIVAAYYDTRASRLNGATPDDLYAQDGLQIHAAEKGGRGGMAAGKAVIRDGQRIVTLFDKADASTFIHESGHHWLDQLVRDAMDNRATESLKADAALVRGWLGSEEGADITTRQHEKFARGFEQYMMEGRAPSRGLAAVFGQFRDWLLKVYGTAKRWGSPINDDIRGVFDRMLAQKPEPVIAEETPLRESLGDIHERVAEDTAAENAARVADTLRTERDEAAGTGGMEGIDAERRGSRAGPFVAGDEGRGPVPDRGGAARQLEPAATGTGAQPGAVGAGGGATQVEGPGLAARAAGTEPREPDQRFPGAGERYVDLAGNIRLDLLGTPEDVNAAIREAADENNEFIDDRRGVLSDSEVQNLADALGMNPRTLDRRKIGEAFNAEQVIAARRLLVQSATNLRDIIAKAAETTAPPDLMEYLKAKVQHQMIQAQVAGITAEAGRALRAFAQAPMRDVELERFIEDASGKTLYQLRREVLLGNQLKTPEQVSRFAQDSEKTGLFDWLQSYFVNALISGPATHGTYTIGNELLDFYRATVETATAAGFGKARALFGIGDPAERVRFGEVGAGVWGWLEGNRNGWRAGWEAVKANRTLPMPGEVMAPGTGFRPQVIPGLAGKVIESPGRLINGLHTLSRTVADTRSTAQQAYRIASNEGLEGTEFRARVEELTANPTEDMMKEAVDEANKGAMMQRAPYGSLRYHMRALVDVGVKFPDLGPLPLGTLRPFRFIDPFVNITSNIIDNTLVQRTPLGLLSRDIRDDLLGRNGGAAQDITAGKMIAGTSLLVLGGSLAATGLLTGSPPADPREAAMRYASGWMPYSVRVGDNYYQVHRLGVLGLSLGIAADLWDVAAETEKGEFDKAASAAVHAVARNIIDESFFRGPSDLMGAVDGRDGGRWARGFVSSFLPFSVGLSQTAHTIDPYMRDVRTTLDAIKAKLPYVSETLQQRYDIWGQPIPNRPAIVPELTELYTSRLNNDPANKAFLDLGFYPAPVQRRIGGIDLTPEQHADYARISGRFAKMRVDAIVNSPGFNDLPPESRHELLRGAISGARKMARDFVMMRSLGTEHDIVQQAVAAKKAALRPETANVAR